MVALIMLHQHALQLNAAMNSTSSSKEVMVHAN